MRLPRQLLPIFCGTLLILHTQTGILSGVDLGKSTGNLLYDDGAGNTLPYRLFPPDDYDENVQYPLVIFFHGAGKRGTDNRLPVSDHIEDLFQATQGSAFGGQYKAFLLAPQCPTDDQWVNWPWALGAYTQEEEPPESQPMHSALAILDQVIADYPIETDQIYVTGISMGGFGTWDALRRRPGKFAGAMPLSGGGNKSQGAFFESIPIWVYHGIADTVIPVSAADEIRDSIEAAGGSIEYTRVGNGHGGWSTFYDNATYLSSAGQSVYEWMFTQTLIGSVPPFMITSVEVSDNEGSSQTILTWNSRARRTYAIQFLDGDRGGWTDLPFSVGSAGTTTSSTFNNPTDVTAGYFRVIEGLPTADLLSDSAVEWLVPADDSLQVDWYATTPPDLPAGTEFSVGSGLGVGFEIGGDDFDAFIDNDVRDEMFAENASIYLRYAFTVSTIQNFTSLDLGMRYDDGFVAYLNGTEIASRNHPAELVWDSSATTNHDDLEVVEYEYIDLSEFVHLLLPGQGNVLAIQGMNVSARGSDFLIEPRLTGEFEGGL